MRGTYSPRGPLNLTADAVIVGSGAGGASAADVLTRAGLDVIMLEEGPFVPASRTSPNATASFPRMWRNGGLTAALGPTPIAYAEGRCVGGGTEINSAIFQRPDSDVVDGWARKYAIADFSAAALAPFLDRAAQAVNASLTSGELGPPSDILRRGGEALGWRVSALERGHRHCVGTNMCSFGCPTGAKQSMTSSLLPLAIERGMRLLADVRVDHLVIRRGRVTGVMGRSRHDGARVHVAAKSVFLACGAIQTPALLQRSRLRSNVGLSLGLHPTIKCIAVFDEAVNASEHRLPLQAITEFMPDQRIGGSVVTPSLFAANLAEDWINRADLMQRWRNCGVYYGMIRANGVGRVRTLPGFHEPIVSYRLSEGDWQQMREILDRLGRAMFAAGAKRVIPSITGHRGWSSVDEIRSDLAVGWRRSDVNLMTIHLFGSCPPGERAAITATDSFGAVREVAGLVVVDGSQLPEAPGCNPQGTIMALAFRNAEAALTRLGR